MRWLSDWSLTKNRDCTLGGRVKLNPWDDHAELIKTTPVAITSARGKMPLEVAPFSPRLTRYRAVVNTAAANAANPIPSN